MSRYRFRQRSQQPSESVIQFVAALKELATFCNFGSLHEEMIRDQLIERISTNWIRERLLLEPDTLTVHRAIQLALQVESAMLEARTLQPSLSSATSPAQQVCRKFPSPRGDPKSSPPQVPSPEGDPVAVQTMSVIGERYN